MKVKKALKPAESELLIIVLKNRFEQNMHRHEGLIWSNVQERLNHNPEKLWSLNEMEATDGEPDVISLDSVTGEYVFYDFVAESPKDRRSLCYDQAALDARKENKPRNSAMGMADQMGIEILNEEQYRELQQFGKFDTKTSSWLKTPSEIRKLGGAIFGDFRYGKVFIYHNGAESYYGARGFRGLLRV
jgi:hypothetical protein